MLNQVCLALRATNPDQNVDRDYVIGLGKDLFNDWSVTVTFGRHKTQGTTRTAAFATLQEACAYMDSKLKRRLSARKRIGCPYQLVTWQGEEEMLQALSLKVIGRFFEGGEAGTDNLV